MEQDIATATPPTNNKQFNKKFKIILIVVSIVAVLGIGIGFSIFEILQNLQKDKMIESLKKEAAMSHYDTNDYMDDDEEINSDDDSIQPWIDSLVDNALEGLNNNYERRRVSSKNYIYYKPDYLLTTLPSTEECFGAFVESDENTTTQLLSNIKKEVANQNLEEVDSSHFLSDTSGFKNTDKDIICELDNQAIGSSAYSDYHNRFAIQCVKISENFPQKGTQKGDFKIEEINKLAESYKNTVGEYPKRFLVGAKHLNTIDKQYIRGQNETYEILNLAIENAYTGDYFYRKSGDETWIYTSCKDKLIGENAEKLFTCNDYRQMIKGNF